MVLSREITERIREVLEKHPEGISITDLVRSVDINRNTAGRYLENLLLSGQAEMRRFGMSKLYSLAKRLPVSSVLSISSELVLQLDAGQRIFYANEPLLAFIGAPPKDLFGKNIEFTPFAIVFEDVFSELLDRFRQGLKGEEWHGEISRPVRGKYFLCRVAPAVTGEGRKGVSIFLEDISLRKRDEERIHTSETRLRSIFKASPVGIGVVSGRVLREVNDRLCLMTGYTEDELVGRSVRMLYLSLEEFNRVGALIYTRAQKSGAGAAETRWVRKDGTIIDVLLNTSPLDPASISEGITFTALDITDRNRAERDLRESEDRYRKLVEISPDAVILHQDGKVIYVNPALVRLLRAGSADDLLGKEVLSFIAPEFRNEIRANITRDLRGEPTPPLELQMLCADGTMVMVEGRGVSTIINDRPAVLVALTDITERSRAERALKASEERYRLLAEASSDFIFVIGRDDRVEYVNSYAAAILGCTPGTVIGKKRSSFFSGELGRHQAEGLRRVLETGTAAHNEGAMEIAGTMHWFDHYLMPVADENGTVSAVLGVSRDITSRRQTEQALRESEGAARALLNAPTDTIILLDSRGIILDLNDTAAQRLGRKREDLVGILAESVLPSDLAQERRRKISRVLTDGKPVRFIDEHPGTWFDNVVYPIPDEQGNVTRVAVIARDITEQKKAETALRENEDRYRSMFENTGTATAIIEENTIVSLMNSECERLFGYTKQEVEKKKSWTDFVVKEDLERMLEWHYQRREGGTVPHQYEAGIIIRSGEVRRALVTITLIPGTARSVVSIIDITDRKNAEDALRASEEQYRFIADNSLDIITRQTPGFVCTYVSPSVTPLLGYQVADLLGTSLLGPVHPDDLSLVRSRQEEVLRSGISQIRSTIRMRHRDGNYIWFETVTRIVRDERTGRIREFISISRDISQRKATEEVRLDVR